MDLAIVIDNSGSIKNESTQSHSNKNYDNLKNFVKSLVDILEVSDTATKVGIVRFSDVATTVFRLNAYSDKVHVYTYFILLVHFTVALCSEACLVTLAEVQQGCKKAVSLSQSGLFLEKVSCPITRALRD